MSLSRKMIALQNDAVENALGGTIPGECHPTLHCSIQMMIDSEFLIENSTQELMASYLLGVLQ